MFQKVITSRRVQTTGGVKKGLYKRRWGMTKPHRIQHLGVRLVLQTANTMLYIRMDFGERAKSGRSIKKGPRDNEIKGRHRESKRSNKKQEGGKKKE